MAVDIVIPAVGESVTSGVLARWVRKDGETISRDDILYELETDKIMFEGRAPEAGVLQTLAKEGDTVNVGAVVGRIAPAPAGAAVAPKAVAAAGASPQSLAKPGRPAPAEAATATLPEPEEAAGVANAARATPLARKVAAEHHIDLSQVAGTGAGQRVREQDVMAVVASRQNGAAGTPTKSQPPAAARGVTRERMSPLRQRIASRLVQAQHTAAMLTTFNEVDMTAVMALRKQHKEDFEKRHGVGLGFMSFFIKAAVGALRAFPLINSFIVQDESGQPAIEKHDSCDIAVAVSTPRGLVVPVLRGCEALSFAGIERGVKELATKAKDGKLTLEEMQGGTFTITNGGVFGSLLSTPILNPPQSAILGMHTIKNRAVEDPANPGQVALRPMMYVALSYDHRIIDGSEAVQFLVKVKQAIEDPQRVLLEL